MSKKSKIFTNGDIQKLLREALEEYVLKNVVLILDIVSPRKQDELVKIESKGINLIKIVYIEENFEM